MILDPSLHEQPTRARDLSCEPSCGLRAASCCEPRAGSSELRAPIWEMRAAIWELQSESSYLSCELSSTKGPNKVRKTYCTSEENSKSKYNRQLDWFWFLPPANKSSPLCLRYCWFTMIPENLKLPLSCIPLVVLIPALREGTYAIAPPGGGRQAYARPFPGSVGHALPY